MFSSTILTGASAETTSMSITSLPSAPLVRSRALEPTPLSAPEYSKSTRKWSLNDRWLAITSRKS